MKTGSKNDPAQKNCTKKGRFCFTFFPDKNAMKIPGKKIRKGQSSFT